MLYLWLDVTFFFAYFTSSILNTNAISLVYWQVRVIEVNNFFQQMFGI